MFLGYLRKAKATAAPSLPPGIRAYAIGDVHGQAGLLQMLVEQIRLDTARRASARTFIIFLGDLIDRGPGSAAVLRMLSGNTGKQVITLRGNHEAALIEAFDGDPEVALFWLQQGGDSTLRSFGVDQSMITDDGDEMVKVIRKSIPEPLVDWLRECPVSYRLGDYFFVHAGVKPGTALRLQRERDMMWIRGEFLDSPLDHGAVIVHGHNVVEEGVVFHPNRIGVDTGAYRTGRLSAVGLEGPEQWSVQVFDPTKVAG